MQDLILTQNESLTMSNVEIAALLNKRPDNVKRTMDSLSGKGLISITQFEERLKNTTRCDYFVNERDSYIVVAQLSPEFTAFLVDEWQKRKVVPPQIPQNYLEALEHLVAKEKQLIEQSPKVEYFNKVLDTTNGFTTTEIATELSMSAIKLNRSLKEMTVQRKIGGRWVLTAANLGNDYTTERTHVDGDGNSRHSMLWTEKGRKFILDLFEVTA